MRATRWLVAGLLVAAAAAGCGDDDDITQQLAEREQRIAQLEAELFAATSTTEATLPPPSITVGAPTSTTTTSTAASTTTAPGPASTTTEPVDPLMLDQPATFESPSVMYPIRSPYLTNDATVFVSVMAPDPATVTINGLDVEPWQPWAGGNMAFAADLALEEGVNDLEIVVTTDEGEETLELQVIRDSQMIRRYGRILDVRFSDTAPTGWLAGVDFGEVLDFSPEFGRIDFEPGEVIVEFLPFSRDTRAIIHTLHADGGPTELSPQAFLRRFESCSIKWLWNILIDDGEIVQLESVPQGD